MKAFQVARVGDGVGAVSAGGLMKSFHGVEVAHLGARADDT